MNIPYKVMYEIFGKGNLTRGFRKNVFPRTGKRIAIFIKVWYNQNSNEGRIVF